MVVTRRTKIMLEKADFEAFKGIIEEALESHEGEKPEEQILNRIQAAISSCTYSVNTRITLIIASED